MDRIGEMRAFVAVADARSFVEGGQKLGLSRAQASRLIARLEARLGTRLLNRTTRDVSLTDTGLAYLTRSRPLLEEFDALDSTIAESGGPRGLLRITAPSAFQTVLQPVLLNFAAAYPAISLEVLFTDRLVNLVEEGFDAGVRITRLGDSSLIARRLAPVRVVLCASPTYLAARGTPLVPQDMENHETIVDLTLRDPFAWSFLEAGNRRSVRIGGRLRFSNVDACLVAARRGLGLARAPAFAVAADLQSGRLHAVLTAFEPPPIAVYAIFPQGRHLPGRVRAFVDFLVAAFAGEPAWHQGWAAVSPEATPAQTDARRSQT